MSCRGHCDQLQTKLVRLQSVDYMQYKAFVETFGDAFMSRTDHVRVLYLCLSVPTTISYRIINIGMHVKQKQTYRIHKR